ncbi:MAG: hypothetical protein GF390_03885 [Candidatus Pacebacteria bacterium]|nr:hypothetical protein [Candidatus Paceibacterota bacterium]
MLKKHKIIIVIIGGFISLAAILIANPFLKNSQTTEPEKSVVVPTKTKAVDSQQKAEVNNLTPQQVVLKFTQATLGTLPDAQLDYDYAKTLMTDNYVQEFQDSSFVPLAYGIQQGPDKIEFASEDINGNQAEVVMLGYWGEDLQMRWKFELVEEAGEWKLDLINPGQ